MNEERLREIENSLCQDCLNEPCLEGNAEDLCCTCHAKLGFELTAEIRRLKKNCVFCEYFEPWGQSDRTICECMKGEFTEEAVESDEFMDFVMRNGKHCTVFKDKEQPEARTDDINA